VINSEHFIFFNGVEGFDERQDLESLASQIKSNQFVNVYVDSNYTSSDSLFVVEKALRALEIPTQRVNGELSCTSNTLVFTNNMDLEGDCMFFKAAQGEEYLESDILVYHLIK
jgi:hypothetical protein